MQIIRNPIKSFLFTGIVLCCFSVCLGQGLERYRTLKDTTFLSRNLGFKKHIQITVPLEYQQNTPQRFPLIIVFDMQNQRQYHFILDAIDFLTGSERMPSAIIVGVEAGKGGFRYRETQLNVSDSVGMASQNEDFLFKELIPMMRSDFQAGTFTVLAGHSRYGFLTTYLLARHPQELNAAVSMSPFIEQPHFSLDTMLVQSLQRDKPKHYIYYRYAMGDDYPADYKKLTATLNANKLNNFDAEGWLFTGADHMTTPGLTITKAMFDIFAYWYDRQNEYLHGGKGDEVKQKIEAHYGKPIPFSIAILNGKGYDFYNKGDYSGAFTAFRELAGAYPNFSQVYLSMAKCQKALKQPADQTLREFKASLAQSSMYTAEQKAELLKEAGGF
ncbi:MAG: alpha/beta hydrolase-fold protein [Mucilaginibacter sp.]